MSTTLFEILLVFYQNSPSLLMNIGLLMFVNSRSSHRRCSVKKCILKNFPKFTGKHLCWSLFFNKVAALRPAKSQVFSCEFWEIFKNTFFTEHLQWLLLWMLVIFYSLFSNLQIQSSCLQCLKKGLTGEAWFLKPQRKVKKTEPSQLRLVKVSFVRFWSTFWVVVMTRLIWVANMRNTSAKKRYLILSTDLGVKVVKVLRETLTYQRAILK